MNSFLSNITKRHFGKLPIVSMRKKAMFESNDGLAIKEDFSIPEVTRMDNSLSPPKKKEVPSRGENILGIDQSIPNPGQLEKKESLHKSTLPIEPISVSKIQSVQPDNPIISNTSEKHQIVSEGKLTKETSENFAKPNLTKQLKDPYTSPEKTYNNDSDPAPRVFKNVAHIQQRNHTIISKEEPQSIKVHIGKIEVKTVAPKPKPVKKTQRAKTEPKLSLDQYLKKQEG